MNVVKEYKQYFTPLDLADFMVNLVPENYIKTIVDLSMGECGLLEAAKKRWSNASFFGADIDETLLDKIHDRSPYIRTFGGDSLGQIVEKWEGYQSILNKDKFDLAIANPPFNYFDQTSIRVDDEDMVLPIEMRFLLKYIDIVRDGGYICIILPYGFLSLDSYNKLRMKLLNKVTIHKVIKIFENCFERIDADTCLLLMQKKNLHDRYVQEKIAIEYLDNKYLLQKYTNVIVSSENNRLDMEYHQLQNDFQNILLMCRHPIIPLGQYVERCKRGRTLSNKKELIAEKGIRFLHTTNVKYLSISSNPSVYVRKGTEYFRGSSVNPENILIGRVGKACMGKIALMPKKSPKTVISDCIFCIEVNNIDPYYLTLYLASKYGQMQLKGLAKGSCSKHLTKVDLLQLKVIVPEVSVQMSLRKKYLDVMSRSGRARKDLLLEQLVSEVEGILGKE